MSPVSLFPRFYLSFFSDELKDLISKILVPEPTARISLADVSLVMPSLADQTASMVSWQWFKSKTSFIIARSFDSLSHTCRSCTKGAEGTDEGSWVFGSGGKESALWRVERYCVQLAASCDSVFNQPYFVVAYSSTALQCSVNNIVAVSDLWTSVGCMQGTQVVCEHW